MKVFIAALATETNTFSPLPTGLHAFQDSMLSYGHSTSLPANLFTAPLHVWKRRATQMGLEVVESLSATAEPAGRTVRSVYEGFRDRIMSDLEAAMPVDIVLLSMHGSMAADGYDDCEGDVLRHVRQVTGESVTVGIELDPHTSLTSDMLTLSDLIVCYKEYPHDDAEARAEELFDLALDAATGATKPVMRDYDCRMLTMYGTKVEPMRSFVDDLQQREGREGVLSLSLVHGFPYADVARVGTRMLAITNGDAEQAATIAREFGERLWDLRGQLRIDFPDLDTAIDMALAEPEGPVVVADVADNAGGGAPGDSTFVLRAFLARKLQDVALGMIWDPGVVRLCTEAGEGARLAVRLGGKHGPMSGDPVDVEVVVRRIKPDCRIAMGNAAFELGTTVWIEHDGLHVVISERRSQCLNRSAFEELGIDLKQMKIVAVKSANHFYSSFAEVAPRIIHMATPGALPADFGLIPYTKRTSPFWPLVPDPKAIE